MLDNYKRGSKIISSSSFSIHLIGFLVKGEVDEKKSKVENRVKFNFTSAYFGYYVLFYPKFNARNFCGIKRNESCDFVGCYFLRIVTSVFFEGYGIKETVGSFAPNFSVFDGMMTSFYTAFYRVVTFGVGTLLAEIGFYKKKKALKLVKA